MAKKPKDNEGIRVVPLPNVNTTVQYVIAIVLIFAIGVIASVYDPDRSVSILAFCGTILVALLAILKGQVEVHQAVNSKMDRLLDLVDKSARAEGVLEGEKMKKDDPPNKAMEVESITTEKIEVKEKK